VNQKITPKLVYMIKIWVEYHRTF